MTLMRRLLVCTLAFSLSMASVWACEDQAQTELQRIYCQIKKTREGRNLPRFNEFKQNPEQTQRLLLKRPAQKLGLKLPQPKSVKATKKRSKAVVENKPQIPLLLADCELLGRQIRCGNQSFELQNNRANSQLSTGALADTALVIPAPHFDNDPFALKAYLQKSYEVYIDAMLRIGLAEVTMSYTKFFGVYEEVVLQQANFSERMAAMFEYLKKEKQTMTPRSRPSNLLPDKIDMCQQLNRAVIICDNVAENWIYLRATPQP